MNWMALDKFIGHLWIWRFGVPRPLDEASLITSDGNCTNTRHVLPGIPRLLQQLGLTVCLFALLGK